MFLAVCGVSDRVAAARLTTDLLPLLLPLLKCSLHRLPFAGGSIIPLTDLRDSLADVKMIWQDLKLFRFS